MGRRARIVVLVVLGAVVVLVAGGYAVLALTGDDAPPPPRLEGRPAGDGDDDRGRRALASGSRGGQLRRLPRQRGLPRVGVRTAVGRTSAVTGSVTVTGDRVRAADLRADMRKVRSDQARRDDTLRYRGIETDRYPTRGSRSRARWRSAPAAGRRPAR